MHRDRKMPSRSNSRSPAPKEDAKGKDEERKRDATPPNAKVTKVTVHNLTRNVGDEHLKEIFGTFGYVRRVA